MMYRLRGLERRIRGGFTALAGLLFVAAGVLAVILGVVGQSYHFVNQVWSTGVPMAPLALILIYSLLALSLISVALGVMMVAFARAERDRSEELLLDPLRYPPFRRGWMRGIPVAVVAVVLLFLLSALATPTVHQISATLQVGVCSGVPPAAGTAGTAIWTIPKGATFALHWYATDGRPISAVSLPGLPYVSSIIGPSSLTTNSSQGWAGGDSNGSAFELWACDSPALSAGEGSQQLVVSGSYYTPLFG
jgi:hypothetical protein